MLKKSSVSLPILGAAALLGACDLPLDMPRWDTAWSLTGASHTVATGDLLPEAVSVREGGFVLQPVTAFRSVRLGDVCPLCTCVEGPLPAIPLEPRSWGLPLPGGVTDASLTGGRARIVLRNETPLDLLDNGRGGRGFLTALLVDRFGAGVLDSILVDRPFPPGDTVSLTFDLAGVGLSRNLVATIGGRTAASPCPVDLEPEDGLAADIFLEEVEADAVSVLVADASVSLPSRSLDLPDFVGDRLRPEDARVTLTVVMESSVALAMEATLSVAASRADLFTANAALLTPIPVPAAVAPDTVRVVERFLLRMEELEGADSVFIEVQNRITGNRRVTILGGESVRYDAHLLVELPSR